MMMTDDLCDSKHGWPILCTNINVSTDELAPSCRADASTGRSQILAKVDDDSSSKAAEQTRCCICMLAYHAGNLSSKVSPFAVCPSD